MKKYCLLSALLLACAGVSFGQGLVPNSSAGTTVNLLAKLASGATTTVTTDTSGILGPVVSGAGTTGNAQIALPGQAALFVFDGATTANDYMIQSTITGGKVHDAGSTCPSASQVVGRVTTTNASAGTYGGIAGANGCGGSGSGGGQSGFQYADQFSGATLDVQLNACIAAAIATSAGAQGICDARSLRSGTIAAQVNVGNHTTPAPGVVLYLPKNATWGVSITNGTSCGLMIYDKSAVVGTGNTSNGTLMVINSASSATHVAGLVCTDPSPVGGGAYIKAESFAVSNGNGGTIATASMVVGTVYDNSIFRDLAVSASTGGTALNVTAACCGTAFYNIEAECSYNSGCTPVVLGGTIANVGIESVGFFNSSFVHPGAGMNNLSISANNANENINFYDLYMEPSSTDTTTPYVEIGAPSHDINFYGASAAGNIAGGSTAYMFDIATFSGPADDTFSGVKSESHLLVNDHVTGQLIAGDSPYGALANYVSGNSISSNFATLGVYPVSIGALGIQAWGISTGVLNSFNGTVCNGFAKVDQTAGGTTLGRAVSTAGSESLVLGIVNSGCGTSGTAVVQYVGQAHLLFDTSTVGVGDAVGLSATPGYGTDLGSASPTSSAAEFGMIINSPTGTGPSACTVAPGCWVQLSLSGGDGGGGGSANAVVTNPALTATNSIQSTATTAQPLTVKCPSGATGTLPCLQVNDNTGTQIFGVQQNDQLVLGAGSTRSLSSGTASNTDLDGELTMSGGTATQAFTGSYTSHPICTPADETAIAAVKVTYTGTASVTFTTSGSTDVVSYHCLGRN